MTSEAHRQHQAEADGRRPSLQASKRPSFAPQALASSRLAAQAASIEHALDRYRAWRKRRLAEEHALIAQLQSHRAKTAEGVKKADELSATLAGIRLHFASRFL